MNQHTPINIAARVELSDAVPVLFRNSLRQIKWGIVVVGLIVLAVGVSLYRQNATSFLIPLLIITLSLPGLLLLACFLTARTALKNNPSYRGDFQYSFSDDGVYIKGIHSKGSLSWKGLHHVTETRRALLLFHDKYNAQILPKRCFASESDFAALRVLIQAHVPNANLMPGEKVAKQ
jgi:hypothetical protein